MPPNPLDTVSIGGIEIAFEDPCPCNSGHALMRCCLLRNGQVRKRPAKITTRTVLAYSSPKCYARALGQCSAKLSNEHYLGRAIMEYLVQRGVRAFEGFPWNPSQKIHPTAVQTKVLCEAHNSALSPIDTEARRFFAALYEPRPGVTLFSGQDIERYLLKVALGMAAATVAAKDQKRRADFDPASPWVRLLFHGGKLAGGTGLYLGNHEGDTISNSPAFAVAPLLHRDAVVGLEARLAGLVLRFAGVGPGPKDPLFVGYRHRPRTIELVTAHGIAVIGMSW